jgi:Flp pilus assembly protein protease CpaA
VAPSVLRLIAVLFLIAAAVVAVLNLHRVANLGLPWLVPPLMIIGVAFAIFAKRSKR